MIYTGPVWWVLQGEPDLEVTPTMSERRLCIQSCGSGANGLKPSSLSSLAVDDDARSSGL